MKNPIPRTVLAFFLVFIIAGISGCSDKEKAATSTEIVDIQPMEAAATLKKESVVVLDVRTPEEVALGRIPGSVNINITGPDFAEGIAKLDPTKTYMVHCARGVPGGRSRRSIDALKSLGVKKVYHLEGGFFGWQDAKNDVEVPTAK